MPDTNISVLLPTRGRTDMLKRSLLSLADLADNADRIEMLLAFDHDDTDTFQWFQDNVARDLDSRGVRFTVYGFDRLGYIRLNEYLNALCKSAQGDWLFFWGDDAIMETQGWDTRISEVKQFRLLRIPAHNFHPYAIWPIVPRKWYELIGYLSAHQLTDSWVSQISYMLDIVHDIDVQAVHDRFDITGNNDDETFRNRPMLEGNPNDPRDFNHIFYRQRRQKDAGTIAKYLRSQGESTDWFDKVVRGEQDPWAKMCSPERDPNRQVARLQ